MVKKNTFLNDVLILLSSILTFLIIGCGKQNTDAPHDDINTTNSIIYSEGWGKSSPTIHISSQILTENQANPSFQDAKAQLQDAIRIWNNAIGKTILILDQQSYLTETGNDFKSGCTGVTNRLFYPLCKTVNGFYNDRVTAEDSQKPQSQWRSGWEYNTGKNSYVLATTIWNSSGKKITAANIRFNRDAYIFGDSKMDTNLYEDNSLKTLVDLRSVAIHELGHALGLGHANKEQSSVMYPTLNIGPDKDNANYNSNLSTTVRSLSVCDMNRIQHIYNGVPLKDNKICPDNS